MIGDSYEDDRYESIRNHSIIGATAFAWTLGVVVVSMLNPRLVIHHALDQIDDFLMKTNCGKSALKKLRNFADQFDTSEVLHFAGEKMDARYYWWDAMVLVRDGCYCGCGCGCGCCFGWLGWWLVLLVRLWLRQQF